MYNATCCGGTKKDGGLGLHQINWAYRARYITIMKRTSQDPNHPIDQAAQKPIHHTMAPLTDYAHIVEGGLPLQMGERQRPQGVPELFEEDSEDGDTLMVQERVVGLAKYRAPYHGTAGLLSVDDTGTVPA